MASGASLDDLEGPPILPLELLGHISEFISRWDLNLTKKFSIVSKDLYPIIWGYYRRLLYNSLRIPKSARPFLNGIYELELYHPDDDIDPFDLELVAQNAKHLKSLCIDSSPKIVSTIIADLRSLSLPNLEKLRLDLVHKQGEPADTNLIWIPLFSKTRNLRQLVINDLTRCEVGFIVDALVQFCPALREFSFCGDNQNPSFKRLSNLRWLKYFSVCDMPRSVKRITGVRDEEDFRRRWKSVEDEINSFSPKGFMLSFLESMEEDSAQTSLLCIAMSQGDTRLLKAVLSDRHATPDAISQDRGLAYALMRSGDIHLDCLELLLQARFDLFQTPFLSEAQALEARSFSTWLTLLFNISPSQLLFDVIFRSRLVQLGNDSVTPFEYACMMHPNYSRLFHESVYHASVGSAATDRVARLLSATKPRLSPLITNTFPMQLHFMQYLDNCRDYLKYEVPLLLPSILGDRLQSDYRGRPPVAFAVEPSVIDFLLPLFYPPLEFLEILKHQRITVKLLIELERRFGPEALHREYEFINRKCTLAHEVILFLRGFAKRAPLDPGPQERIDAWEALRYLASRGCIPRSLDTALALFDAVQFTPSRMTDPLCYRFFAALSPMNKERLILYATRQFWQNQSSAQQSIESVFGKILLDYIDSSLSVMHDVYGEISYWSYLELKAAQNTRTSLFRLVVLSGNFDRVRTALNVMAACPALPAVVKKFESSGVSFVRDAIVQAPDLLELLKSGRSMSSIFDLVPELQNYRNIAVALVRVGWNPSMWENPDTLPEHLRDVSPKSSRTMWKREFERVEWVSSLATRERLAVTIRKAIVEDDTDITHRRSQ